jgi:hypothetical protein
MKTKARIFSVLMAALMVTSLPASGAVIMMGQDAAPIPGKQKDECLLVAKNCYTETINERVQRLEREIAKGTPVYTESELNKLKRDLKDAERVQKIYNDAFPPAHLLTP